MRVDGVWIVLSKTTCIESTDPTKNGPADTLVDELASVFSLSAQEQGYSGLCPNPLGT
jgi:hypothetical protein